MRIALFTAAVTQRLLLPAVIARLQLMQTQQLIIATYVINAKVNHFLCASISECRCRNADCQSSNHACDICVLNIVCFEAISLRCTRAA
jgi:hypothetical protein